MAKTSHVRVLATLIMAALAASILVFASLASAQDKSQNWKQKAPSKASVKDAAGTEATSSSTSTTQASTDTRALGVFIQDVWSDPATKIDEFTTMVGTPPRNVMWYQNWEQSDKKDFDPVKVQTVVDKGAKPVAVWVPRDPTRGANQSKYALQTILNGTHDAYITKWAQDAAAWGKSCQTKLQLPAPCTMHLRFAHEMNGTWFPWSPNVNGNSTTDFINAWRYVHGIFQAAGATNVRWVWSPYIECGNCTPFSKVYPGGAYVDWVGLDGFNWGTTQSWSSWQSMAQVFGPSYDKVTALAPSKPFMIAETASAEAGDGDTKKAEWITNAFNTGIPNRLPKTQAIMWFSSDRTQQGETDWRVNSSVPSLEAYQNVAKSASWQDQLPAEYNPSSTTTINSGPSGTVNSNTASFTFSSSESSSFECRLDGGAWTACTSPKEYTGLSNGTHTFEAKGNVDLTPAGRTWTVATTDTTAPSVNITSPINGATGVARTTSVSATFSEEMKASTITTTTFRLVDTSTGNRVSATVSCGSPCETATLTPSQLLAAQRKYKAVVTTGVKDMAGNAMTQNRVWYLTTGS